MAKKISELTELEALDDDDLIPVEEDSSGVTKAFKYSTLEDSILTAIGGQTSLDSTTLASGDLIALNDVSDGLPKVVTVGNLKTVVNADALGKYTGSTGNSSMSGSSFDVWSNISAAWETIAPTGTAGSVNIWPALNLVPVTADYILVKTIMRLNIGTTGKINRLRLYARKYDTTIGFNDASLIAQNGLYLPSPQTSMYVCCSETHFVPLNNAKFELYLLNDNNYITTATVTIYLIGYGYNEV